jgi:hypothetical protein
VCVFLSPLLNVPKRGRLVPPFLWVLIDFKVYGVYKISGAPPICHSWLKCRERSKVVLANTFGGIFGRKTNIWQCLPKSKVKKVRNLPNRWDSYYQMRLSRKFSSVWECLQRFTVRFRISGYFEHLTCSPFSAV